MLAAAHLPFTAGGNWSRLNFTLTPSADAPCEGIAAGSDPTIRCPAEDSSAGHICVKCGGTFVVGMREPGDALVDFVFLQPPDSMRFAGLPVHKHTVETLLRMGVSAIRFGGSFVSYYGGYYFWKDWRGPPWLRPSVGAHWQADVMSSWGPFEQIDVSTQCRPTPPLDDGCWMMDGAPQMCNAAGVEPIITTTAQDQVPRHTGPYDCCSPDDMGDLVEYCWGNASTVWGRQRIDDGHPEPYRVRGTGLP